MLITKRESGNREHPPLARRDGSGRKLNKAALEDLRAFQATREGTRKATAKAVRELVSRR